MIMLLGADPEALDKYTFHIRSLHEQYGAKTWFLVYQADVRLRSERLERIRRSLSPQEVQQNKVWSTCFIKAIDMESTGTAEFWNREVHRPASDFRAGTISQKDLQKDGTKQSITPAREQAKKGPRTCSGVFSAKMV